MTIIPSLLHNNIIKTDIDYIGTCSDNIVVKLCIYTHYTRIYINICISIFEIFLGVTHY